MRIRTHTTEEVGERPTVPVEPENRVPIPGGDFSHIQKIRISENYLTITFRQQTRLLEKISRKIIQTMIMIPEKWISMKNSLSLNECNGGFSKFGFTRHFLIFKKTAIGDTSCSGLLTKKLVCSNICCFIFRKIRTFGT